MASRTSLAGVAVSDGYAQLLHVSDSDGVHATTVRQIYDGDGTATCLKLSGSLLDVSGHDGSAKGLKLAGTLVTASAAELNRAADKSASVVDATGATLTITAALHGSRVVTLNRAAGVTVTLPAASGTGEKYTFVVGTTVTSNNNIIQVVGNDTMTGTCSWLQDSADTVAAFETAATSDTITCNGSTKGGIKGDIIELIDIAADLWSVRITGSATGTESTPFSAAVS